MQRYRVVWNLKYPFKWNWFTGYDISDGKHLERYAPGLAEYLTELLSQGFESFIRVIRGKNDDFMKMLIKSSLAYAQMYLKEEEK